MDTQTATVTKDCTKCGRSLPSTEFPWLSKARGKRHSHCTDCKRAYMETWRAENAERVAEYARRARMAYTGEDAAARRAYQRAHYHENPLRARDAYLRQRYGITLAEYREMEQSQGGRCAICGGHQVDGERDLAVDHHHGTGKVRGLLCGNCNRGVGMFADDPALLARAITYLTEST